MRLSRGRVGGRAPHCRFARLRVKVAQLETAANHPPKAAGAVNGCVDDSLAANDQPLCDWIGTLLNDWISSTDEICADNYTYIQFKLKNNGRSEKVQIYLYVDKCMAVERPCVEVLYRVVPPPCIGDANVLLRVKFHASRSVRFKLGQCDAHDRKYTTNCFSYRSDFVCVC